MVSVPSGFSYVVLLVVSSSATCTRWPDAAACERAAFTAAATGSGGPGCTDGPPAWENSGEVVIPAMFACPGGVGAAGAAADADGAAVTAGRP